MAHLRNAPPRPRLARVAPSYPRTGGLLAVASFALAVGCGGVVENAANRQPEPNPAGGIAIPYDDAQPPPDTGRPDTGAPETAPPMPEPAGAAPYPYEDTGPLPDTDGGEDTEPTPEPAEDAGPAEGAK